MKPVLVPTAVASVFICRCQNREPTEENMKRARERVYYLAKNGYITRHGAPKRGQALWDLHELARPYRHTTIVVLP